MSINVREPKDTQIRHTTSSAGLEPKHKFSRIHCAYAYDKSNPCYIKDSFQFAEIPNNIEIPENYVLILLDVVNLFDNITKPLILKVLNIK